MVSSTRTASPRNVPVDTSVSALGVTRRDGKDLLTKMGVQLVGSAGFALTTPLTSTSTNCQFRAYRLAYQLDAHQQKTPISVETRLET